MKVLAGGWSQVPDADLARTWDSVAAVDPAATFFHTRRWAGLMSTVFPGTSVAARAIQRRDGTVAIFPAVKRSARVQIFDIIESSMLGVYGGPIVSQPLTAGEMSPIIKLVTSFASEVNVTGNPYANWNFTAQYATTNMFTHVVDLGPDESELYSNLSNGCRGKVNKARRQGLTMEFAMRGDQADEYFKAYEDSIRRWGDKTTSRYDATVFRRILEIGQDNARIWLVKKDDVTLGGIVVFYHGRHAVHWHSGYFESAFAYGASNFAVWEAMKDAKQRGYEIFDMNPSAGLEGVIAFKEGFGATVRTFERGVARRPLFSLAKSLKGRLTQA